MRETVCKEIGTNKSQFDCDATGQSTIQDMFDLNIQHTQRETERKRQIHVF